MERDRITNCISCGASNFIYYDQNKTLKLPIYICQSCKLYVTGDSKIALDVILNDFYKKEFWDQTRKNGLKSDYVDPYSKGRIRLWKSQFKYCREFIDNNKTILEIGSGHGEAIIQFDNLGFRVTGIEPDKMNVDNINKVLKHSKVILDTAETFRSENKFDIVWMSHVFEHLVEPIQFLKRLQKSLKPGGILFIEVPNVEKENDYRKFTVVPHAFNFSKLSLSNSKKGRIHYSEM